MPSSCCSAIAGYSCKCSFWLLLYITNNNYSLTIYVYTHLRHSCLKREFPMDMVLTMWEACWVNYLTDHFHLFLCLAIMCVYADDVVAQDLRTDEMLLHFSSLAMYMDGGLILRKARGLLHQFRQLDRLPCTLAGLCRQCGPGMWDSSHDPVIECVVHGGDGKCPHCENYERVTLESGGM